MNTSLCESLPEYPSDDNEEDSPSSAKGNELRRQGDQGDAGRGWGIGGFISKLSDMVNTSLYW